MGMRGMLWFIIGIFVLGACETPRQIYKGYVSFHLVDQELPTESAKYKNGDVIASATYRVRGVTIQDVPNSNDNVPIRAGSGLFQAVVTAPSHSGQYYTRYEDVGFVFCTFGRERFQSRLCFSDNEGDKMFDRWWKVSEVSGGREVGIGFVEKPQDLAAPIPYELHEGYIGDPIETAIIFRSNILQKRFFRFENMGEGEDYFMSCAAPEVRPLEELPYEIEMRGVNIKVIEKTIDIGVIAEVTGNFEERSKVTMASCGTRLVPAPNS